MRASKINQRGPETNIRPKTSIYPHSLPIQQHIVVIGNKSRETAMIFLPGPEQLFPMNGKSLLN